MSAERPTLPVEVVALFEGSDEATLVKFARDHAVQAAIREMLAARTERERQLAFAMASLASKGILPTSDFAPGTHIMLELGTPKHPGVTRTITTRVVDNGLHRVESDTCSDGFKPVHSIIEVGDAVHVCSKDLGPTGKLEPLTQVTAGLGVWLVRQGTSRPLQVGVRPNDEQLSMPLVLERLVADDTQVIPPIGNADARNS
jgi:hypothetical protein